MRNSAAPTLPVGAGRRGPMAALCIVAGAIVLVATGARAAEKTVVTVDAPALAEPRYSQAIEVVAHLARATGGAPVLGSDCQTDGVGQPCRIELLIARASTPEVLIFVADPVVDETGTASTRLAFVNGRYTVEGSGESASFVAAAEGEPYVVTGRFRDALKTPVFGECDVETPEDPDGDFCGSTGTRAVAIFNENPTIELGAGPGITEGNLSEPLTLSAEVTDPTGDAAPGGTDVDGPGAIKLVGVDVAFFYDVNNDGNPALGERVGIAQTNSEGVASLEFVLNPDFVLAGTYDNGIHAEFSGDDRFGVARASTRLVVHPGPPSIPDTVLEATPPSVPADGNSVILLRARLVDGFNNVLNETSPPHDVTFTTDLGILEGDAALLDPLDGTYTQELRAQRAGGTATVQVFVDGEAGPTKTVEFEGAEGCQCGASSTNGAAVTAVALLALLRVLVGRRHLYSWRGGLSAANSWRGGLSAANS